MTRSTHRGIVAGRKRHERARRVRDIREREISLSTLNDLESLSVERELFL